MYRQRAKHHHGLEFGRCHAEHSDGTTQMLVTARSRLAGQISIREFKTVTGIVSFLTDCGFTKVSFPVIGGGTVSLTLDT